VPPDIISIKFLILKVLEEKFLLIFEGM